jgi:glycine/D-amino acid oxidase-like deaminating enzyme
MTEPVAVVGAGIVGMTAARALQRGGYDVVVLDPDEPGAACSFGNAGHIAIDHIRPLARMDVLASLPKLLLNPLGPLCVKWRGLPGLTPWLLRFAAAASPKRVDAGTAALAALLRAATPAWQDEIAASGLSSLFRHQGALLVYESRRSLADAQAEGEILTNHGVRFEMLNAEDVARRAPGIIAKVSGGRWYPDASHVVDPHGVVRALAERFVAEGGAIERAEVTGFDIAGGRVRALHTSNGARPVGAVVLAAGAGAGPLARRLGAHAPLTRERGYHVMLSPGALELDIPVTFAERGFVATPMAVGTRFAGTVELGAGPTPDWRRAEILLAHGRTLFGRPALHETSRWFGDRPTLPDYLPMIGTAPHAGNAVLALGHQHLGLTLAAVTGRLVAEIVLGKPPSLNLKPFRTDRFGVI